MKTNKKPKTKTLLFIRHAIALDSEIAAQQNIPDIDRELTSQGIKKFQRSVKKHKKIFKNVDSFVSSPLIRARQTLGLILQLKSAKNHHPKVYKKIRPSDSPKYFIKYILAMKSKKLVAVSHEPFMSHLMKALFGPEWKPQKIKKGQIIKIQIKKNGQEIKYKTY